MAVIWREARPLTVHEVVEALDGRPTAYTTAMTVIERLREKGWLTRERFGRSYRYIATHDEDEYAAHLMSQALEESNDRGAALLNFAGHLDAAELEQLRRALTETPDGGR